MWREPFEISPCFCRSPASLEVGGVRQNTTAFVSYYKLRPALHSKLIRNIAAHAPTNSTTWQAEDSWSKRILPQAYTQPAWNVHVAATGVPTPWTRSGYPSFPLSTTTLTWFFTAIEVYNMHMYFKLKALYSQDITYNIYIYLISVHFTCYLLSVSIQITARRDLVDSSEYAQLIFLYCIFSPYYIFSWPEDGPQWPKYVRLIK